MSIVTEWGIKTRRVGTPTRQDPGSGRSAELRALDAAVLQWATGGIGPNRANIVNVDMTFAAWKGARGNEYAVIKSAADELDAEISANWDRRARSGSTKASGVKPVGYVLTPDPAVPSVPFKPIELMKMNEAFARAKRACEAGRDAVIKIAAKSSLAGVMKPMEQAYVDYFGDHDRGRARRVLDNFNTLCAAFSNTPEVVDWRQQPQYGRAYAATQRGGVTSGVKVYMGGAFFLGAMVGRNFVPSDGSTHFATGGLAGATKADLADAYDSLTDFTVATFVHEFAHASFWAVDAPPVNKAPSSAFADARAKLATKIGTDATQVGIKAGYIWRLAPNLTNPADNDYGASPNMWVQASTPAADKQLAEAAPDVAVRNADNYGQFARMALKHVE